VAAISTRSWASFIHHSSSKYTSIRSSLQIYKPCGSRIRRDHRRQLVTALGESFRTLLLSIQFPASHFNVILPSHSCSSKWPFYIGFSQLLFLIYYFGLSHITQWSRKHVSCFQQDRFHFCSNTLNSIVCQQANEYYTNALQHSLKTFLTKHLLWVLVGMVTISIRNKGK
jgi:hypothetical protein